MVIDFVKMHGTGNDYIYVDCFRQKIPSPDQAAIHLSHRHFGIGADGLILIKPTPDGDGEMEMFNADGSKSQMCGNGLRCVAKYIHDHHAQGRKSLRLLTGAGWLGAEVGPDDSSGHTTITLDMGEPIFEGKKIPVGLDKNPVFNEKVEVLDKTFTFSSVSMGNPHCVIYVDKVADFPVDVYGPALENHSLFPERINVEFVEIVSRTRLIQRTWERGSGETWACGTGAAAVSVVSHHLGHTEEKVAIQLLGGELGLDYKKGGSVKLTGNAVEVFRGQVEIPG